MRRALLAMLLLALAPSPAGALEPAEIAILVRRDDAMGMRLARYYCDQRDVPRAQIIVINLPAVDELAWDAYRQRIVEPVRADLTRRKLESKVRCLLLAGRMPLRVIPDPPTRAEVDELEKLKAYVADGRMELYQQAWRVEQVARGRLPDERRLPGRIFRHDIRTLDDVERWYDQQVRNAQQRISDLDEKERVPLAERLAHIRTAVEGLDLLDTPRPDDPDAPDHKQKLARWQADRNKLQRACDRLRPLLYRHGPAAMRDNRRRMQLEQFGLRAALRQVQTDIRELSGGGRTASLDSELALLWHDNYTLDASHGNPLSGDGIDVKPEPDTTPTAVMVCRLDTPDPARAIKIVDECKTVEKLGAGIVGRFCIDALGLPEDDPDNRWDRKLTALADWDARPRRMVLATEATALDLSPTKANDVGFYFGWTDKGELPAGFRCATGAIAVSYNDNAADGLHVADSARPGARMLDAGAAAFIGVLDRGQFWAVPAPEAFAEALVAEGRPLAEAFWKTCPRTSWRTVLVGDPLYRPFPPAAD